MGQVSSKGNEEMRLVKEIVFHVLKSGMPLCGFSKDVPQKWPKRNWWIYHRDKERRKLINCQKCMSRLKKLK